MSLTAFGATIISDRAKAKQMLERAFIDAKGKREDVAQALGGDVRSVYRWADRLGVDLHKLAAESGFDLPPGPPRLRDRVLAALVEARGNVKRAAAALGKSEKGLRATLAELDLYDEANRMLAAGGFPAIERPRVTIAKGGA